MSWSHASCRAGIIAALLLGLPLLAAAQGDEEWEGRFEGPKGRRWAVKRDGPGRYRVRELGGEARGEARVARGFLEVTIGETRGLSMRKRVGALLTERSENDLSVRERFVLHPDDRFAEARPAAAPKPAAPDELDAPLSPTWSPLPPGARASRAERERTRARLNRARAEARQGRALERRERDRRRAEPQLAPATRGADPEPEREAPRPPRPYLPFVGLVLALMILRRRRRSPPPQALTRFRASLGPARGPIDELAALDLATPGAAELEEAFLATLKDPGGRLDAGALMRERRLRASLEERAEGSADIAALVAAGRSFRRDSALAALALDFRPLAARLRREALLPGPEPTRAHLVNLARALDQARDRAEGLGRGLRRLETLEQGAALAAFGPAGGARSPRLGRLRRSARDLERRGQSLRRAMERVVLIAGFAPGRGVEAAHLRASKARAPAAGNRIIDDFDPTDDFIRGGLWGKSLAYGKLFAYNLLNNLGAGYLQTQDGLTGRFNRGEVSGEEWSRGVKKAALFSATKLALSFGQRFSQYYKSDGSVPGMLIKRQLGFNESLMKGVISGLLDRELAELETGRPLNDKELAFLVVGNGLAGLADIPGLSHNGPYVRNFNDFAKGPVIGWLFSKASRPPPSAKPPRTRAPREPARKPPR